MLERLGLVYPNIDFNLGQEKMGDLINIAKLSEFPIRSGDNWIARAVDGKNGEEIWSYDPEIPADWARAASANQIEIVPDNQKQGAAFMHWAVLEGLCNKSGRLE